MSNKKFTIKIDNERKKFSKVVEKFCSGLVSRKFMAKCLWENRKNKNAVADYYKIKKISELQMNSILISGSYDHNTNTDGGKVNKNLIYLYEYHTYPEYYE